VAGNGYRWYAEPDLHLIKEFIPLDILAVNYDPRGVLTSFRPPLYPAFLALIYFLTGVGADRFFTTRLAQAFLGAALVPLTYLLAHRLSPRKESMRTAEHAKNNKINSANSAPALSRVLRNEGIVEELSAVKFSPARIAAWVVAFYPMLVIYPLALVTENLFFLLTLLSALALLRAVNSGRWPPFALAGFLFGLTALTRSVISAAVILAVLLVWFALKNRAGAVALLFFFLFTISPWVVRNTFLHGRFTWIESSLGYQLYLGYHPDGTGTFQYPQSLDLIPILDDAERDRIGIKKALQFIRDDPGRFPYLAVRRLGHFFALERRALTYFYSNNFFGYIPPVPLTALALLLLLPFVFVATSAAFGLAITHWSKENLLLALLMFGYLGPHVLIIAEDRFHMALIPFLAILAAQCWMGGLSALRERWQTPAGPRALAIAAFAVLLLLLNWSLELWRDADKLGLLFGPGGNQTYFPY
jgi:4-amino-4-deoxy-L-arabinose transferase-like glycosyltransferase